MILDRDTKLVETFRGDSGAFWVTFEDDPTGYEIIFSVRPRAKKSEPIIVKRYSVANMITVGDSPFPNRLKIEFTPHETGLFKPLMRYEDYYWGVKVRNYEGTYIRTVVPRGYNKPNPIFRVYSDIVDNGGCGCHGW